MKDGKRVIVIVLFILMGVGIGVTLTAVLFVKPLEENYEIVTYDLASKTRLVDHQREIIYKLEKEIATLKNYTLYQKPHVGPHPFNSTLTCVYVGDEDTIRILYVNESKISCINYAIDHVKPGGQVVIRASIFFESSGDIDLSRRYSFSMKVIP